MIKKEFTKYIIAGISAVATDFIAYRLLSLLLLISIAKTISYILGMVVAFYLNRTWTFKSKEKAHSDLMKFIVLYTTSLALNVLTNHAMLYFIPTAITFAFLVATGVSVVINYIGQKFWVFKKK
jgi:putative flippase GtrA